LLYLVCVSAACLLYTQKKWLAAYWLTRRDAATVAVVSEVTRPISDKLVSASNDQRWP